MFAQKSYLMLVVIILDLKTRRNIMKQGAQVKKYILELLSDGKEHTTIEIREYILTQNIRLDKSSTLIRNILHNLKQQPRTI